MSAFIVHPTHINYLVNAAHTYNPKHGPIEAVYSLDRNELGAMLMQENITSVQWRYADTEPNFLPGYSGPSDTWRYLPQETPLDPVTVLSAIGCYRYQSCEHVGWAEGRARHFCDQLERAAIRALPGMYDAPYHITR